MMSINQLWYRPSGVQPMIREDGKIHQGGFGFSVNLSHKFAKVAMETPMTQEHRERLKKLANYSIKALAKRDHHIVYGYYDDSWLVTNFMVPGDACSLDLSRYDYKDVKKEDSCHDLCYDPHNVDSPLQVYSLISIVDIWVSTFEAVAGEKLEDERR